MQTSATKAKSCRISSVTQINIKRYFYEEGIYFSLAVQLYKTKRRCDECNL
jgi:hypothetical protein